MFSHWDGHVGRVPWTSMIVSDPTWRLAQTVLTPKNRQGFLQIECLDSQQLTNHISQDASNFCFKQGSFLLVACRVPAALDHTVETNSHELIASTDADTEHLSLLLLLHWITNRTYPFSGVQVHKPITALGFKQISLSSWCLSLVAGRVVYHETIW